MDVELIADSANPGEEPPIAVLESGINATVETINVVSPVALADLKGPGQFRIRIDHEVLLVESGQTTKAWKVKRAVEGPGATSHATNAQIFHPLTRGALLNLPVTLPQLPAAVALQTTHPLGAVSGTVTPNLSEGRNFTMTPAAGTSILKPSNYPAGAGRLVMELEWFGEHTPTFPFIAGWIGNEPEWAKAGPNSARFFTDDGTTWHAEGAEGLPANTVRVAVGPKGDVIVSDGTAWVAGELPPSGLTEKQVEEIAAAKAATAVQAGYAAGSIRVGNGPNSSAMEQLSPMLEALAQGKLRFSEPVTSNQALVGQVLAVKITNGSTTAELANGEPLNVSVGTGVSGTGIQSGTAIAGPYTLGSTYLLTKPPTKTETTLATFASSYNNFYPVTVPGLTLTMPNGFRPMGSLTIISNRSGGAVKLKGSFSSVIATTLVAAGNAAVTVPAGSEVSVGMRVEGKHIQPGTTIEKVIGTAVQLTLPVMAGTVEGEVVNLLYEPAEVETTVELEGEETIGYAYANGSWRAIADHRSLKVLKALITSVSLAHIFDGSVGEAGYTALSLSGPVEQTKAIETWPASGRLEANGTVVRLCGELQVLAGKTINEGGVVFTLPSALRPPEGKEVRIFAKSTSTHEPIILTSGHNGIARLTQPVSGLLAGWTINLEGASYRII
jgi:hypothetical protein